MKTVYYRIRPYECEDDTPWRQETLRCLSKTKVTEHMENNNLIESFAEFKEFKNIDRTTLMKVLEDINKMGTTIVMSTHNRDIVNNILLDEFEQLLPIKNFSKIINYIRSIN